MAEQQSFKNHARIDPLFHRLLAPVGLLLLIGAIVALVRNFTLGNSWRVVAMIWAILALFKIRLYALKVQDRVIRLEERLRMEKLLPDATRTRIDELEERQLIALRFASDAELPGLVEKTLSAKLGGKEIKQAIQTWRPDNWRV